jgi:hypothetical protein
MSDVRVGAQQGNKDTPQIPEQDDAWRTWGKTDVREIEHGGSRILGRDDIAGVKVTFALIATLQACVGGGRQRPDRVVASRSIVDREDAGEDCARG